jgi:hypothetical protein
LLTSFDDFLLALKREVAKVNVDHTEHYQENPKHKSIGDYTARDNVGKQEGGSFTHSVRIMLKRKNGKRYYAKLCADKTIAMREVIAQEFSRLILPYHPKTRLAKKTDEGQVWVLSEEIEGSVPLERVDPKLLREGLLAGTVTGLGNALAVNLAKKETDAKLGNIMVTPKGKIFGIDGDWSFSDLTDPTQFDKKLKITEKDIANLPFVNDYKPYHWLDIIQQGKINPDYLNTQGEKIFTAELRDAPQFRQEINETMLKMLILPLSVIQRFVGSYMRDPDEINLLSDHINDQLVDMRKAALTNESFKAFMDTPAARKCLTECVGDYVDFIPMKKQFLLPDNSNKYIKEMYTHYQSLLPAKPKLAPITLPSINTSSPISTISPASALSPPQNNTPINATSIGSKILPPISPRPQVIQPAATLSNTGLFKPKVEKTKPRTLPPINKPKI